MQAPQTAFQESAKTLSASRAAGVLHNWRLTPATLMAHLDPNWIPAKWLQYLSLKIAIAVAKGNCGLLISAPPRHGKSQLSTIATPLWVLENFPDRNVIVSTYGEELSTDFTRQVRDLIQQNQSELKVRLRQDARRVNNLLTTEGGGLKAVGLRGAITGRGADVFVLDDYIKEPKEAMSPTYLEDLWTWYLTVARTRLEPGAVVIILATRWVANDLHGRIIKRQKETGRNFFEYVELPAIAMEGEEDPIGRAPGEVLFPERYNQEAIYDIRTELGTRWFTAMFQQRPQDDETRVLNPDWFKKIDADEFKNRYTDMLALDGGSLQWIRAWDFASTKEAGDYTSGALCLWNKATDEFFIRNIARGQWSSFKVEEQFVACSAQDRAMAEKDHVSYKIAMEQEPGSSGAFAVNHFRKLLVEARIINRLVESRATTSKLLNAQPIIAAAEAGKVYVVCDYSDKKVVRGWGREFYDELETFPEGAHDDQVDSVSLAYKLLTGKQFIKPTFGRGTSVLGRGLAGLSEAAKAKRHIRVTFGRALARVR